MKQEYPKILNLDSTNTTLDNRDEGETWVWYTDNEGVRYQIRLTTKLVQEILDCVKENNDV